MEQGLQEAVHSSGPEISGVGGYILKNPGKRIRPTLFLLSAYSPGQDLACYIDGAVALELLHTASLLHDDVIDEAALRRGRETVHERWHNTVAVLCGDYLLGRAYRKLLTYQSWPLMEIIAGVVENMTEGEMAQALADMEAPDIENSYYDWIGKKTAKFFSGCCQAGSLLRGDLELVQDGWARFGFALGMAFQLADDLLDYNGRRERTGKPLFGDLNNGVLTLPLIRTLQQEPAAMQIKKLVGNEPVKGRQDAEDSLDEIIVLVRSGDGLDYTFKKAQEYAESARDYLDSIPELNTRVRSALHEVIEHIFSRDE